MRKILLGSLVLSLGLNTFAEDLTLEKVKEIGSNISKEFESILKKELKDAKKSNNNVGMTDYCINDSKKVTEELNKKYGPKVSVKRVSLNNRNDKAKADEKEKKILEAFDLIQKSDSYQPDEIIQVVDDNTYKVYTPIVMNSRDCKICHGMEDTVDKDSKKRFSDLYKNENGYGYKSGEVRGAVVVTISK